MPFASYRLRDEEVLEPADSLEKEEGGVRVE